MKMNKKGQSILDGFQNLIIPLVSVGIILVIGFLIMAEARDQVLIQDASTFPGCNATNSSCSLAYNGTTTTIDAMSDIPQWLPIIVITVIGALLIGLVSLFRRSR